jgi:hypothetical protein
MLLTRFPYRDILKPRQSNERFMPWTGFATSGRSSRSETDRTASPL